MPASDPGASLPGTAAALRRAMGQFASSVTVVATVADGVAHALTATAVCSVSLEPPLVLVCVGKTSRFHAAVVATGRWTLSILAADQGGVARHFATSGRDLATQFDRVPHHPAPVSGAPVLVDSLAWLDLRTWSTQDAGDHTIVVGEVLAASAELATTPPLTYLRGTFSDEPTPTS